MTRVGAGLDEGFDEGFKFSTNEGRVVDRRARRVGSLAPKRRANGRIFGSFEFAPTAG